MQELSKEKERIIQRVFGDSDSILAQSWVTHDTFMIGYAEAFAKAFEESFVKGLHQEGIERLEPEALRKRELELRLQALRYLLPYCTSVLFPKFVDLALKVVQIINAPEQLRSMLNRLLVANTDEEAIYALSRQDLVRYSEFALGIVKEGLEDGEREGMVAAFLQVIDIRFPSLLTETKQTVEEQKSIEQMRALFNKLCQSRTIEEAQAALKGKWPGSTLARAVLLTEARKAALKAYAPYSKFRVGAAVCVVMPDSTSHIVTGVNVENASFGLALCAERNALAAACTLYGVLPPDPHNGHIAAGLAISHVAVACIDAPPDAPAEQRTPCGACRQWFAELAPDAVFYVDGIEQDLRLDDLLPMAFRLER